MAEVIKMPRLSDTMEEGVVAQWLKKVGDKVSEGDILAEIETDKATMEFESFYDGTLLHIAIDEGVAANVDTMLCIIGEENEDISSLVGLKNDDSSNSQLDLVEQINQQEKNEEIDQKDANTQVDSVHKEGMDNPSSANVEFITMPRLSDTMEEGTISTWLKKVGDQVSEGDILAEIETDKATMEFESFYEGNLVYIGVNEGETVKVDDLIAIISDSEVNVDDLLANYSKGSTKETPDELDNKNNSDNKKLEFDDVAEEVVSNVDVLSNPRIFVSPLAKKIAAEKNIDLSKIKGSGDNGRIVKNDLDNVDYHSPKEEVSVIDDQKDQVQNAQAVTKISNGEESFDEIQNSSMRNAIAKRLSLSKFSAPHYYLGVEFNMDNAIAFRDQYNSIPNTKISFNDIIIKACAAALKKNFCMAATILKETR